MNKKHKINLYEKRASAKYLYHFAPAQLLIAV